MFTKPAGAADIWTGPATAAFEFWASFWPTAPLFGVEWRYADLAGQWTAFTATGEKAPAKKPAATRKPARAKTVATTETVAAAETVAATEAVAAAEPVETAAIPEAAPAEVATEVVAVVAETAEPGVPASLLVTAPADADDLTAIKGIGAGLARQLNGLGVYKLSQLAGFSQDDLAWIDANLSSFKGRCFRDDWAGQAKALLA